MMEEYSRDGYVVLRNRLTAESLDALRAECDSLRKELAPSRYDLEDLGCNLDMFASVPLKGDSIARVDRRAYGILRKACSQAPTDRHNVLINFLFTQLPDLVEEVTGWKEQYLFNEHYVVKDPKGSIRFAWHRDADKQLELCGYDVETIPYISTWVPLEPVNEVNGSLVLLPESHFSCYLPPPISDGPNSNSSSSSFASFAHTHQCPSSSSSSAASSTKFQSNSELTCCAVHQQFSKNQKSKEKGENKLNENNNNNHNNKEEAEEEDHHAKRRKEAEVKSEVEIKVNSKPGEERNSDIVQNNIINNDDNKKESEKGLQTVTIDAQPGDIVLFSSLIWHFSGPNTSSKPRRVHYCQYSPQIISWAPGERRHALTRKLGSKPNQCEGPVGKKESGCDRKTCDEKPINDSNQDARPQTLKSELSQARPLPLWFAVPRAPKLESAADK